MTESGRRRRERRRDPYADRQDEIGALARSIGVFQHAMHRNVELNRPSRTTPKARDARNVQHRAGEIERFGVSIEKTLQASSARIADTMRRRRGSLTGVASNAADRTGAAAIASDEAANNVAIPWRRPRKN